jgi:hypothetical protein
LAYIGYHFLKGRIKAIVYDIEWAGSDIIQFLLVGVEGTEDLPTITPINKTLEKS